MNRLLGSLVLIFVSYLGSASAFAGQTYPHDRATLEQFENAIQNTFRLIKRRAQAHLNPDKARLLARTQLVVGMRDWGLYETKVRESETKPTIYLPIGLVVLQDYVDSAIALGAVAGVDNANTMAYIGEFLDRVRLNQKLFDNDVHTTALPHFMPYSGMEQRRFESALRSDQYANLKEQIKISSFGFLLLHEFAHLVWPDEHYTTREVSADLFAIEQATSADMNPLLAFFSIMFFSGLQGEQFIDQPTPTHEAPMCRALYAIQHGVDAAEQEPDFASTLRSQGTWRDWQRMKRELPQVLEDEDVNCPSIEDALDTRRAKKRMETVAAVRHGGAVSARIWRPTGGLCNGIRFDLYIDDEFVDTVDNTRGSGDQLLGRLGIGEHEFEFDDVTGFCIQNQPPYHMERFFDGESCAGTFSFDQHASLQFFLEPIDGGLRCGIL